MMQKNSKDLMLLLRGKDSLKVKSTFSEVNDISGNIRVENLDQLKNSSKLELVMRVANQVLLPTKNNLKSDNEKKKLKMVLQHRKDLNEIEDWLKVDERTSNIKEKMNWERSVTSRSRDSKQSLKN